MEHLEDLWNQDELSFDDEDDRFNVECPVCGYEYEYEPDNTCICPSCGI